MTHPRIGIVGPSYVVPRFWGELRVEGVPSAVIRAVAAAGGIPLVLPASVLADVDLADTVDGLVLAGGDDLGADPGRDRVELALVERARAAGLPLLGICRGLQVMAVSAGGVLVDELPPMSHVLLDAATHAVETVPGSLIRRLVGERAAVNSLHHQAVASCGRGWQVTARADDGVVEAIEWVDLGWPALGVQWHPELMPADRTTAAVMGWLTGMVRQRPLLPAH